MRRTTSLCLLLVASGCFLLAAIGHAQAILWGLLALALALALGAGQRD